jgi:hypothetical protein
VGLEGVPSGLLDIIGRVGEAKVDARWCDRGKPSERVATEKLSSRHLVMKLHRAAFLHFVEDPFGRHREQVERCFFLGDFNWHR